MSRKKATGSQRSREKAVPAYEEAVESVRQWNEALKGSSNRNSGRMRRMTNDKGKSTALCSGRPFFLRPALVHISRSFLFMRD